MVKARGKRVAAMAFFALGFGAPGLAASQPVEDSGADVARADALFESGDCRNARPILQALAQARPDDYVSTSRLANCLLQLGDNQAALEWSRRAAEFSSERPNRLLDMAILYTRMGDHDRAFEYLAQATAAIGYTYRVNGDNLRLDPVLERALALTDEEAAAFLRDPGGRDLAWYARWRRPSQEAPAFPGGELPRQHY